MVRLSLAESKKYRYFNGLTTYINNTTHFLVVVGAGFVTTHTVTDNQFQITVANANLTLDAVMMSSIAYGTPASQVNLLIYMPRRMLVPPNYQVQTNLVSQLGLSLVECLDSPDGMTSLENALAIL